jgi:H+-transporting ATPase
VEKLCEAHVAALGARGIRAMAVAKTDSDTGAWKMLGLLTFLDPPRPDTKETIRKVRREGGGSTRWLV